MITDIDAHRLKRLIKKMRTIHKLSDYQINMKKDERRLDYSRDYTRAELEAHYSKFRASADLVREKEPEKSDHHIGWQISMMDAMIDDYTKFGYSLAPHHPWRITVLLRKDKAFNLERDFLSAYFHLFWSPLGSSSDTKLGERALKVGIDIPHPPNSIVPPLTEPISDSITANGFTVTMDRPYLPHIRIYVKNLTHEGGTNYHFDFGFDCKACGGNIIVIPDDADERGNVSCKSCGTVFGPYGYLTKIMNSIAKYELKRRGL